ncbi:MAG: VanW family protein [Candidatus Paceibacteria bacterium]
MSFFKSNTKISISIFLVAVLIIFFSGGYGIVASYQDRALPNVYLGGYNFGGLTEEQIAQKLQKMNDVLASEGVKVEYVDSQDKVRSFNLNTLIVLGEKGGNTIELISTEPQKEAERLVSYGKQGGYLGLIKKYLLQLSKKKKFELATLEVDESRVKQIIKDNIGAEQIEPKNAQLEISSIKPLEYQIKPSRSGFFYNYQKAVDQIKDQWSLLKYPEVRVEKNPKQAQIKEDDLRSVVGNLGKIFTEEIELIYNNENKDRMWGVTLENIRDWAQPKYVQGEVIIGIDKEKISKFIEDNIAKQVNKAAQNAKFEVDGKRVKKFTPAENGLEVDLEQNVKKIEQVLQKRMSSDNPGAVTNTVNLAVKTIKPDITVPEVNNLGIEEKLGTGVSNFAGSPANRVHNIQVGSNKLDGLLIPPGEEFSAVKFTRPYTRAAGYLPELVIKGEELKPELGGGLCQLGTTLFRMAMEAGMPITERRNHSLVVNYYADPVNGLPGTDATIYNPKPDFRFKNTTDDYVLIQTEVDVREGKLYYTLWGDDDGRSASTYTHPTVSNWYQPGKKKVKETTSLPPGKTKCQKEHIGADASFTYKRVLPNGETKERVFTSHYRPLPQICLKGVEKKNKEEQKQEETSSENEEQ